MNAVSTVFDVNLAPSSAMLSSGTKRPVEATDSAAGFYERAFDQVAAKPTPGWLAEKAGAKPPAIKQLILSGGGQEGAFGAGFLKGADGRDDYDIVTGVSTGALQATFALLGRKQYDRPPFTGDFPARLPGATALDDLVSGYSITTPKSLFDNHGEIAIITKAAQGGFDPLRRRARELLQPGVFAELLKKGDAGGQLYVALLNWDTGHVVIVDMIKLARNLAPDYDAQRDCFTEILVAASSEPLAVPPVNIDGTLYMDAGLRFGVFSKAALDAGDRRAEKLAAGPPPTIARVQTDVIVNGLLEDPDPESLPAKYDALDLVAQARHILATQIYRFSVADVMRRGPGHAARLVYIDLRSLPKVDRPKSMMFNSAYMQRLIAEGTARGRAQDWSIVCNAGATCFAPAAGSAIR